MVLYYKKLPKIFIDPYSQLGRLNSDELYGFILQSYYILQLNDKDKQIN